MEMHASPAVSLDRRLSRRKLLLAALALPQVVAVVASAQEEQRQAYDRDFERFDALSSADFYDIVNSHTETPVLLSEEPSEEPGWRTFSFTLLESSPVYLSASVAGVDRLFIHPMIVRLQSGRRYLLPLIQSEESGRRIPTSAHLGQFEAGSHVVAIGLDQSSALSLPTSLRLQATRPDPESLLAKFLDYQPVIKLKTPNNVLDDMPLLAFSQIHKRENTYRVTSSIIFSSENGGLLPDRLMRAFGRTVDIEWVMQQLFRANGDVIRTRRRFQRKDHGTEQFAGRESIESMPVLATATANNLFSDGQVRLWRWTLSNPFVKEVADPIYYSPKPLFMPPGTGGGDLVRKYPDIQQWSLIELAMEGCVVVTDHDSPDGAAFLANLDATKQEIRTTFPSRGCKLPVGVPVGEAR